MMLAMDLVLKQFQRYLRFQLRDVIAKSTGRVNDTGISIFRRSIASVSSMTSDVSSMTPSTTDGIGIENAASQKFSSIVPHADEQKTEALSAAM